MTEISTLNPGLATDIVLAVGKATKRGYPNSGQIGTLSTVAMLMMSQAANKMGWEVYPSQVMAITGLSKSTINGHLRFWAERGVLRKVETTAGPAYRVVLAG